MAAHKNQHYVPRVHFRPFSDGGEGRAISLYASHLKRFIHGASIGGQCSGDYFYGSDLGIEKQLQELEGRYATILRDLLAVSGELPPADFSWLRLFWCMQWGRTDGTAQQARGFAQGAADLIDYPDFAAGDKDKWVMITMGAIAKAHTFLADLAPVLLRNCTDVPFITSDNPAVTFNRLLAVHPQFKRHARGVHAAGTFLMLPLAPSLAVAFYDRDVYSVHHRNGWFDIRTPSDVLALNEHQVLNCVSNVYFSRSLRHDWIPELFRRLGKARSQPLWSHQFFARDGFDHRGERFKAVASKEARRRDGLLVASGVPRDPVTWPSFIGWRTRGFAFDTGTGMGVIRRSVLEAHPAVRARQVRIDR